MQGGFSTVESQFMLSDCDEFITMQSILIEVCYWMTYLYSLHALHVVQYTAGGMKAINIGNNPCTHATTKVTGSAKTEHTLLDF